MTVLKQTLFIVLIALLSLTRAFIFLAKPVFGIQLTRRTPSRSSGTGMFQASIERVPIYCQQDSIVDGTSDDCEPVPENPADAEPALEGVPDVVSLEEKQAELTKELHVWENKLRLERIKLNNLEDKLSESGKNGYYLVQAQLQDFRRKVELDQKKKVSNDRRDYIVKLLPLIDAMREATQQAPASTPRGEEMHESYQSLLAKMMELFEKYGYKEFSAACGDSLDPKLHQISTVLEPTADAEPVTEGTILLTARSGVQDENNKILRKALVAVAGAPSVPTAEAVVSSLTEESESESEE